MLLKIIDKKHFILNLSQIIILEYIHYTFFGKLRIVVKTFVFFCKEVIFKIMGTETKSISQSGNFANSQIARNIKEQQTAVQDHFTKKLDKLYTAVEKADETAKKTLSSQIACH